MSDKTDAREKAIKMMHTPTKGAIDALDAYGADVKREALLEAARNTCYDCGCCGLPVEMRGGVFWHKDTKTDCNAQEIHELLAESEGDDHED